MLRWTVDSRVKAGCLYVLSYHFLEILVEYFILSSAFD